MKSSKKDIPAPDVDASDTTTAVVTSKSVYRVADGKSVTSRRGIISGDTGDDSIEVIDLMGGQKAMNVLIEKKYIVKR